MRLTLARNAWVDLLGRDALVRVERTGEILRILRRGRTTPDKASFVAVPYTLWSDEIEFAWPRFVVRYRPFDFERDA